MALAWIAADALTGRVLADLPTLDADWPLRRQIGAYATGTAHLHLDGAPPNWRRAVKAGAAVLHCYDDTDPALAPQWSGLVTSSEASSASDVVDLSLVTAEGYFDRRYVGDRSYVQVGQNAIVADLARRFGGPDAAAPFVGLPLSVQYTTPGDGTPRDRTYLDADDTTLYARLQQLAAVLGGPEWVVEWAWSSDGLSILPVLMVGDRVGEAAPAGLLPAAAFELPGCITEARIVDDYSAGKGATVVQAVSSGQGDVRPTSGPVYDAGPQDRPAYEHRWTPSTSITNVGTLQDYARAALAILAPGAQAITLTAALEDAPRLGTDWRLGNDVQYVLDETDGDGRPILAFPGGAAGVGRAIAYELNAATITPILAASEVYTESDAA
ncbi:MAG TPA: hypothetical protein VFL65_00880 [Jatrophihabitans sp.]|nr:hypothetical protein [Jatrophihabitans sp.]